MKVCNDDIEIKKRLRNYNPKRAGRRLPVNGEFKPEKLKSYLIKGLTESDLLVLTYNLLSAFIDSLLNNEKDGFSKFIVASV
ncbi:hypothetical protein [Salmonella sp. SAL04157]|uniref:hypothetical protein n=1 Tax=Salmonella sp. SAL04157 TaxID=3159777 RepID=UPI003388CF88|nr:hypothetical protein [Salmonella enterica]